MASLLFTITDRFFFVNGLYPIPEEYSQWLLRFRHRKRTKNNWHNVLTRRWQWKTLKIMLHSVCVCNNNFFVLERRGKNAASVSTSLNALASYKVAYCVVGDSSGMAKTDVTKRRAPWALPSSGRRNNYVHTNTFFLSQSVYISKYNEKQTRIPLNQIGFSQGHQHFIISTQTSWINQLKW